MVVQGIESVQEIAARPLEHRIPLRGNDLGNFNQSRDRQLTLPQNPKSYLTPRIVRAGFALLPVLAEHTYEVFSLPLHHLDPFDRLLIAQARVSGLALVTSDRALRKYDVRVIAL